MRKLVLATKNTGKVAEFERLLSEFAPDIKVLGLADFPDMPEVIESGSTLHENARLKAKAICDFSKLPALADDSGLFIDALGGQPGIYSARWAGPDRDFYAAMAEIERQLQAKGATDRSARFICALALVYPDGREQAFEGEVVGEVVAVPRGTNGFGYDPIFVASGHTETFGELDPAVKHAMSHRADAFAKFVAAVLS